MSASQESVVSEGGVDLLFLHRKGERKWDERKDEIFNMKEDLGLTHDAEKILRNSPFWQVCVCACGFVCVCVCVRACVSHGLCMRQPPEMCRYQNNGAEKPY